jgi:hypothetical protein
MRSADHRNLTDAMSMTNTSEGSQHNLGSAVEEPFTTAELDFDVFLSVGQTRSDNKPQFEGITDSSDAPRFPENTDKTQTKAKSAEWSALVNY